MLRPSGHPDRPATLLHLAQALLYHYEKQGSEESTPGEITKLASEVQAICSVDSHECRSADLVLQTWALYTAITSSSLTDVNKLIPALRQAVQYVPQDYFDKLQRLANLGLALRFRYHLCSDLDDLNELITTYGEAMQFRTPCSHPCEPTMLTNHGVLFLGRFGWLGIPGDLSFSISLAEDAVRCTPDHHYDFSSRIATLGTSLLARFRLLGEPDDLHRSISLIESALRRAGPDHPERPAVLTSASISLLTRFHELGNISDLDSAVGLLAEGLALTTKNHSVRRRILIVISSSCFALYKFWGNLTYLNISISYIEEGVGLSPCGHFERPMMLAFLGTLLCSRFQASGELADLDKVIGLLEEIIQIAPDYNSSRPPSLGRPRTLRFQQLDDLFDLDRAISTLEAAVQRALLEPLTGLPELDRAASMFEWPVVPRAVEDLSERFEMLTSLGDLFRARFRKTGNLDRSIGTTEDALA